MKLIQISAPNSNSGKTISTMLLLRCLKNLNYDVQGFKCGPDFIDSEYLSFASGRDKGNLDIHLMGRNGIKEALGLSTASYGILEGAMGYFDGMGIGWESSAYDIARELDINTILVYEPKGEMFTIIPKLKGMIDYSKGRIVGVIFTKINKMMYNSLKSMVEENLDISVLGFIEKDENLKIESRNLGLYQPSELMDLDKIMDSSSKKLMESLDIEKIMELFKDVELPNRIKVKKSGFKVAIAKDEAFSFHYGENEKLLSEYFDVEYFSPIHDEKLPLADFVIIGGGYPELFKEVLSNNIKMRTSILEYVEAGGHLYGESGGLLYLSDELEGVPMCKILKGKGVINNKLQNFGYVNITLKEDCILGNKDTIIPAHEFHYSSIKTDLKTVFDVEKASKSKSWNCGYRYKNALMGFQHINFAGNENIIKNIIKFIEEGKDVY